MPRFDSAVGRYVYLTIDGIEYRVYFEETGRGIPMLLQHTAGADARQWRHLLEDADVQAHFRMIAYDLPYHGKSLPPESIEWWRSEYRLTRDFLMKVPDEEIDALALDRPAFIWAPGTTIFEEGDRGDSCYVIYSGSVKVVRRLVDGQPIALAHVGHAGIVGELALFAADRRSATVQAVEPTTAVAISREDLMAILHGNAHAAISMAVHVAGLLQKAEDRRFASATSTVNGRILATLLAQVEARQALHPGDGDIELVGSPTDLARLAGAYAAGIVKNHPFIDGNKRTGFMMGAGFLERNGLEFFATEVDAVLKTLALAAGKISEAAYATWLRANSKRA